MEDIILTKLKQISLFNEIKEKEEWMQLLSNICKIRKYHKDETIIQEGDVGTEMFIALNGSAEILKKTRAGDSYTIVKLDASSNVFFGELALVDDDKRSATVIASENSSYIVIEKDQFLRLGNSFPAIGLPITRAIAKLLSSRLRKTSEDMITIFDALVLELQE